MFNLKSLNPFRSAEKRAVEKYKAEVAGRMASAGMKFAKIEDIFGGIFSDNGAPLTELRNFQEYMRIGSSKVWATWKACDLVGNVAMDTPMPLIRKGGDGTPVKHKEINDLMENPNPFDTWTDMLYKWVFHMKLCGNAFWAKDQVNLNGDRPAALYPLNPKRVRLVVDGQGVIIGYVYMLNGVQVPFEPNEIIHWKRPHPDNQYWGLGDIEAGANLFDEHMQRDTWNMKFWRNGASASGIMILEDMVTDEKQWEQVKIKWQRDYGGSENSGKTAWLSGKWKYQQLGLTAAEMQHIENAEYNLKNIFRMHQIPLSIAGIEKSANYATAQIDDLQFRRYAVKPFVVRFVSGFNKNVIEGFDKNLQISPNIAGLTNVNEIMTDYGPLFDRGVVTINELREKIGMKRVTDDPQCDAHFILTTYTPLELSGTQDTAAAQQQARAVADNQARLLLNRPAE